MSERPAVSRAPRHSRHASSAILAPTSRNVEIAAWARRIGAVAFALACWEIFLRVDSAILATTTKLWLFPLLAIALAAAGGVAGAVAGIVASAAIGAGGARALRALALPWIVALATGLEYALVAYHHLDGTIDWRVLGALAAAALAASLAARRRTRDPAPSSAAAPRTVTPPRDRRWVMLGALALASTALLAWTARRPDVFYALLKRDSALGRALGHSLAPFPPTRVTPPAAPPLPSLRARAPLGPARVVLLTIDALRADALPAYGAPDGRAPRLAALADAALVFADAYTQTPNSAPSVATLLTGLYPFRHGVRNNRMPLVARNQRLPEALAAVGYATAAFVTNPNFGEPFQFERGFGTFRYLRATLGPDGLVRDTNDPEAVTQALAWAGAHRDGPFFLWVHLMAPHSPYIPPDDLATRFASAPGGWFDVWNVQGPEARLAGRRISFDRGAYATAYAGEVASADRLGGRLLDGLEAAGVLADAHVMVLADHGEAFGESDVFGHGRSLDRAETRVPLLWRLPRASRVATITTTVQLADVMPTLLDLLGVAAPSDVDGRDLAALLVGEAAEDDGFAFTESRYLHSMGVRGLLYGGRTRTHTLWLDAGYPCMSACDRRLDPDEHVRRRADEGDPLYPRVAALARAAQATLGASVPAVTLDAEQRERLRALGYAQ